MTQLRWYLTCAVGVLLVLAEQVPSPAALLRGGPVGHRLTVSGQLDALMLTVVGVVVWVLVLWVAVVLTAAGAAHLLGGGDTGLRMVLRCCAPRAVRGVLITALGLGAVGALSACAPAAGAGDSAVNTTVATSDWQTDGSYSVDWPAGSPDDSRLTSSASDLFGGAPPTVTDAQSASVLSNVATTAGVPLTQAAPGETSPNERPSTSAGGTTETRAGTEAAPTATTPNAATPNAAKPTEPTAATTPAPAPAPAPAPTGSADVGPDAPAPTAATPETVASSPAPGPTVAPGVATDAVTVTVVPGDSLWSIAADHLEPGATDAEIAASWPKWYAANRALIGDNPDLIQPGWPLSVPTNIL